MYYLESEDLTHLGGPMGTEYTTTNYRKYFKTIDEAKKYAEKECKKPIEWVCDQGDLVELPKGKWGYKNRRGWWTSGDMGYVMYNIRPVKVEK